MSSTQSGNLTQTARGRRVLFTAYYFVEGAPIGFLWWSLPAILRSRDVGTERIGALLGWLVLPWAFKWLWAPLIDSVQGPRWTLRAWIGAAQVGMGLTLLPLLLVDDPLQSNALFVCLVAHAVFAATQDASIDALMIRTTAPDERGRLSGWMQVGMLTGRSLLGGGALLVLSRVGGTAVVAALLAVIVLGLGLLPFYRAPLPRLAAAGTSAPHLSWSLGAALRRRTTWIGLAFAALAGAGFEAVGAFAGPLLTERSAGSTDLAGRFFLVHAVVAMAAGGLAGGRLADRVGARRGTVSAGLALGATILATAAAIELGDPARAQGLIPWLTAVYVTIGWFTASSYALFMEWTDDRLGATQFSAFMGATNLCEAWAVLAAGRLIPELGYGPAFGTLAVLGLFALALASLRPSSSNC